MLLRQAGMDGRTDGLREKERRGSGDRLGTFREGERYSLGDAGFALMDLLSMRSHVSLLRQAHPAQPLIK